MDTPKRAGAAQSDDSRLSPFSRMLKQPRTNAGPPSAGASRNTGPESSASPRRKPGTDATSTASVGATITIKGDVMGTGDMIVSGVIEGTIDLADNQVTVEGTGQVKGSIVGKQVLIKGRVLGDIEALEKLSINATGAVQGTIVAPRIAVEDGAKFKGRIDMDIDEGRKAPAAAGLAKN